MKTDHALESDMANAVALALKELKTQEISKLVMGRAATHLNRSNCVSPKGKAFTWSILWGLYCGKTRPSRQRIAAAQKLLGQRVTVHRYGVVRRAKRQKPKTLIQNYQPRVVRPRILWAAAGIAAVLAIAHKL